MGNVYSKVFSNSEHSNKTRSEFRENISILYITY